MKHILLFFLSDIHLQKDTQLFQHTFYTIGNGKKIDCIQTNESAIQYLIDALSKSGTTLDAVFYFSSKKTKKNLSVSVAGNVIERTHEEWFRQRIKDKFPTLRNDFFHVVDYDEDKDTNESIQQVISMTDMIKTYLVDNLGEKVYLHADMTGGFRHASMMMLSVMQLLRIGKYVEIGKVLYSNWEKGRIEDVTEVHRMFTLVSGADEFVNFGSVTEIEKYFESTPEQSETLQSLLSAMREFSFAVKICRTNRIEKVLKLLLNRINDFKNETKIQLREEIFQQIINIIVKEYGELLSPNVSRLDIIRWCIHKGFLQQAMTLCTEWLPFFLVEKKICYTDDKVIQKEASMQEKKEGREWQQSFIISYNKGNKFSKKQTSNYLTSQPGLQKAVNLYLAGISDEEAANAFPEASESLFQLFNECKKYPNILQQVNPRDNNQKKLRISEFKIKAPMMEKACRVLWRQGVDNDINSQAGLVELIGNIRNNDNLIKRIESLREEYYPVLLGVAKPANEDSSTAKSAKSKWENRSMQYEAMFKAGIIKTNYPNEMMELLKGYHDIRIERNHINHANDDGSSDSEVPIDEMMLTYLDKLERFK